MLTTRLRRSAFAAFIVLTVLFAAALVPNGGTRAAAAAEEPASPKPLKIVLVGDSYSAGNGARDANGDRDYYGPKDCYRSHSNWAEKYVDHLRTQGYSVTFINRACSGAVTDNLLNSRKMDTRQGVMLRTFDNDADALAAVRQEDSCNTDDYPDEETWRYEVVLRTGMETYWECTRYLTSQLSAIGSDTDLVLFTIGGNDIGFSNIVKQCFLPIDRSAKDCEEKVVEARNGLPGVHTNVVRIIDEMRAQGLRDDARVVLGGYPLLALDNDYDLSEWGFGYNYKVADEVRRLGLDGDAAQEGIIEEANTGHPGQVVRLSGIPQRFEGHEPDGRSRVRNEQRWIWELFETKIQLEWYHMNPQGHIEYADHLAGGGIYGAGEETVGDGGDIDVVLVLDTTGSMGSSIEAVRQYAISMVDQIAARTTSARFALVTYRDDPAWTGWSGDYPSRVEQTFTGDAQAVKDALSTVTVDGGGDWPETMYSGVMAGLDLPWRPGVKKAVVVLADAPPHDPEPISGIDGDDVILKAFNVDPAEVSVINTGDALNPSYSDLSRVVEESGGVAIDAASSSDVPGAILEALTTTLGKPYAWINGPYVGAQGDTIEIDGSGSYATSGLLTSYEWDFDQDGTYDQTTSTPMVSHTFSQAFSGVVTLRVTDDSGRTNLATTHVGITDDGDETPRALDNCPDIDNHGQEDFDGDGIGDMCDDTPGWEGPDREGVIEGPQDSLWPFAGFLRPVDNLPVVNLVKAGSSVPMKFGLGGDRGLDIPAPGSPTSVRVACDDEAPEDGIETLPVESPGLTYDATTDHYTFVWQTAKSWSGTCRRFVLSLADGSSHQATFRFR